MSTFISDIFSFIYGLEYGSNCPEDPFPSKKIKTIKIKIKNFCKESNTEINVVEKTLPTTMTINRLKDLGKRLFSLGNKQLEFSYITKEVNIYFSLTNIW